MDSVEACLKKMECNFVLDSGQVDLRNCQLVILLTEEDLLVKKEAILNLEKRLATNVVIAINTETIALGLLQKDAVAPERIIGVNWTAPADLTYFMEVIANDTTRKEYLEFVVDVAKNEWGKDPYVIQGDTGIRMNLLGALIREAFFLIENGYASVEDIDRACRNDPGYYLPFAGNLRYMDLMGTYAYGMVMKDLNPELSKNQDLPEFFEKLIANREFGMIEGKGFYEYREGEAANWNEFVEKFAEQAHELMGKYPFQSELTRL